MPFKCRILIIVDARDVIKERLYRRAKTGQEALAELKDCAGSQFDPRQVEIFSEIIEKDFKTK